MIQTSLDRYFSIPRRPLRSGPSFLDLPYDVREKVYVLAGVVRDAPIILNTPFTHPSDPSESAIATALPPPRVRCACLACLHLGDKGVYEPFSAELMYTCRAVSQEVLALLYSRNKYWISRTSPGGLSALEKIHPRSIARLRHLRIALSEVSDCEIRGWADGRGCPCHHDNTTPLRGSGMSTRNHQIMMAQWRRVCSRLARYITADRLSLSVICDCDSYDLAAAIAKPLEILPTLTDFAIRLHAGRDNTKYKEKLLPLAQDTVWQMTTAGPKRLIWDNLLWEIRERILEFTDLVAPYDLTWSAAYKLKSGSYAGELNRCWTCSSLRDQCCETSKDKGTWAFQCRCWRFPLSLFLTSRQMREDATRIFYSRNHFHVQRYRRSLDIAEIHLLSKWDSLAAFLDAVPADAVRYLRSLQIVLSDGRKSSASGDGDGDEYKVWDEAVGKLQRLGTVSQLSLTLDMSESRLYYDEYRESPVTKQEDDSHWEHYERLVEPIKLLGADGLRNFFVHLAWPVYVKNPGLRRGRWERRLECLVMGRGYDGEKVGGKYAIRGRWFEFPV